MQNHYRNFYGFFIGKPNNLFGIDMKTGLIIVFCCLMFHGSCQIKGKSRSDFELPKKGLCAHRGAMATYPENTISAFRAAVKAGAHMVEFDVWLTKDNEMVVIHDATVDRTTNGKGKVSGFMLSEIKKLDAGSWKAPEFTDERIPTLEEVLNVMPHNIWLNIHIKGEGQLPVLVANLIAKQRRLHQAFLACNAAAARKAKDAVSEIMICNMERQESDQEYVTETIRAKADFIQLRRANYPDFAANVKSLKESGIRVNYFGTDSPEQIKMLFENGVDFPLVNDIVHLIDVARELNIEPVQPLLNNEN
jgi:glycerophosphoryl diester phosphodiesterase